VLDALTRTSVPESTTDPCRTQTFTRRQSVAPAVNSCSHSRTDLYQCSEFCGFRIQWFSFG